MITREVNESDYLPVITVLNDWWGGRQMAAMLPHLFFKQFNKTSFIVEENGNIIGFLIGFISQTYVDQAYIHFAGVHPDYRTSGIGRKLYNTFFSRVKEKGCTSVYLVTSPINKKSITYHTKIGFEIIKSDCNKDGIWVHKDYSGSEEDRILFVKKI